jgi:hypothetical protein
MRTHAFFLLNFTRRSVWDKFNHMALSPELLEILRCPKCKSEVELRANKMSLKCVSPDCGLVYPIRDDIPVMLIDEATLESESEKK